MEESRRQTHVSRSVEGRREGMESNDIQDTQSKKKFWHTCKRQNVDCGEPRLRETRQVLAAFAAVLGSLRLSSLDQVDNLKTLQQIVTALERQAMSGREHHDTRSSAS